MTVTPQLLGELLAPAIGGYAGAASSAFLQQHSEIAQRSGPDAFDLWKAHFEERLSELAAALAFDRPALFAAGCAWARAAAEARGVAVDSFHGGLGALEGALVERFPEGSASVLAGYFGAARAALELAPAPASSRESALHRALLFLKYTLEGDAREAARFLVDSLHGGAKVAELFEEVVVPAQREVGELWHRGEINVAEEHLATLTTQKAIAVLAHHAPSAPANGKTVVISSVPGDTHDLGLRLLGELFALAGWRSVPLGADVPRLDLLQSLDAFDADLLVLSATLARHLIVVRTTIQAVREHSRLPAIKVLVGGRAFRDERELWREIGADGWAASLRAAVEEGERLVPTG